MICSSYCHYMYLCKTVLSLWLCWFKTQHKHCVIESESCSVMSDSLWPHGLYSPWNSPGQNTGVGSLSFLQGIFPTQGSNPGLIHVKETPVEGFCFCLKWRNDVRFVYCLKLTHMQTKSAKCMTQQFLRHWSSDSGRQWSLKNKEKLGEPYSFSSLLPWDSFYSVV